MKKVPRSRRHSNDALGTNGRILRRDFLNSTLLASGATLQVRTGQGQKGLQVMEVLEVDESTATAEPPRRERSAGPRPSREPDLSTAVELQGTVKWYNPAKGFGFIEVEDGGKDVFVHVSALERSGVGTLTEGQRVTMRVVDGRKGREAAAVTVTAYA